MGKPKDPHYWRRWRATHPAYRKRETDRARSRVRVRDRTAEYAKRASRAFPPLTPLYPALNRGTVLSFWEDELRMDIEQERALARCEGRDPDHAAKAYADREGRWHLVTVPIDEAAA